MITILKTGAWIRICDNYTFFAKRLWLVLVGDCEGAEAWTILSNMNVKKCDCKCFANAFTRDCRVGCADRRVGVSRNSVEILFVASRLSIFLFDVLAISR